MSDHKRMNLLNEAFLKKIEYLYVISKKVFTGKLRAERKTKKVASGIEFADHRNYAPGDDIRALDWRLYARTEKLLIRLFEEKEDLKIYFLIDISASMLFNHNEKLNYAKQMAAALGYIGLCNQDRVGFIAFNDKIAAQMPTVSGRGQIFKIFNFLEQLQGYGETSFENAFKSFAAQNKRRGVAVVISDFQNPGGNENALKFLRYQQFETYVIHLVDPNEIPSQTGDVTLIDAETHEKFNITITPKLIEKYKKTLELQFLKLESFCAANQMLYFKTPITTPFDEMILKIFRKGGFIQ